MTNVLEMSLDSRFRGNDVKIITFRDLCVIRGKKFFVSSVAISMNILIPQLAPQYLADVGPGRTDHSRKQPPATAEPYAGLLLQGFYSLAKILCRTIVCSRGNDVKIITFRVLCVIRGKKLSVYSAAMLMNILIPQLAPQYLADVGPGQPEATVTGFPLPRE